MSINSLGSDGYSVEDWGAVCLECGSYGKDIVKDTCLECGATGESIVWEDANA